MLTHVFQNRSAALTRWLGLFLIVFILYGTTVEAAHRHGRVMPSSGVASLVDSNQPDSPSSSRTGCNECLICQLHQSFSTTLIAYRLVDPPKQVRTKVPPAVPPDIHSRITGPTAGRAPPFIS
jgi:hypothetical protein